MVAFFSELGRALRSLTKTPSYALTCIPILALAIGANTAIFSILSSVVMLTPGLSALAILAVSPAAIMFHCAELWPSIARWR